MFHHKRYFIFIAFVALALMLALPWVKNKASLYFSKADEVKLAIVSAVPAHNSTNVSLNTSIAAIFNQQVEPWGFAYIYFDYLLLELLSQFEGEDSRLRNH